MIADENKLSDPIDIVSYFNSFQNSAETYSHMITYLNEYNFIRIAQSGFREKHSCEAALNKDDW